LQEKYEKEDEKTVSDVREKGNKRKGKLKLKG
jgi:hypothetical protein